ncbi:MAG TPA: hypothetical protein VHK69_00420, partial [Chitinophagaceae bacterium]|nr:hypothetical protein [Chitinophagaceae bacterium]
MKRWLLLLLAGSALTAQAQMKEGKVVYERTIQMGQFRPQGMPEEVARQLPPTRTMQFELLFSAAGSLRQLIPDMTEDGGNTTVSGAGPGGGQFVMRFGAAGADDIIYHNFEQGRRVDQRELFSKTYIVEDSIRRLSWKISEETKK